MLLPIFQTAVKDLQLLQNKWSSILNPLISNPTNSALVLKNIQLQTGTNSVNHLLQQNLQGWFIVRIDAAATIYDQQKNNQTPQLTLTLVSSAPCEVDICVF